MTTTEIILSLVIVYMLIKIYKNCALDDAQIFNNRVKLQKLARKDWKQGRIDSELYSILSSFFHPDLGNLWDYVPPERQEYTSNKLRIDSQFWEQYRIRPDFVLPPEMVYELYKDYAVEHLNEIRRLCDCRK